MPCAHDHWSHYDPTLEQADFEAAQDALSAGGDLAPMAASLAAKAQSYGYAEADGFLTGFGGNDPSDDNPEQAAYRQSYDAYQDGDYWGCIDRSERLLREAASPDQVASVHALTQGMRDAFEEGRRMRTDMDAPTPTRP